ncbi:hypothetical protein V8E53_008359 [Lactarius tabidus]
MCLGVVMRCLLFNLLDRWFARPNTASGLPGGVQVVFLWVHLISGNLSCNLKEQRWRGESLHDVGRRPATCTTTRLTWITGFEAVASPRFDS